MTVGLFQDSAPFLPWLRDETLFSLCSRHHRLWGNSSSWKSSEVLFGGRRSGTQHDLPSALKEFSSRTSGCFGTADHIARERTLLRYYRPFLPPKEVAEAVVAMSGPTVAHLKFRLGLLTSRFRANHPLKSCAACLRDDFGEHGWVYWHLQHQFPGVWFCPSHGEPLLVSTLKSTGVERFLWHLPDAGAVQDGWLGLGDASAGTALQRLARLITDLVGRTESDDWLNPGAVQVAFRSRLTDMDLLTSGGNLRLKKAAESYLQHCAALRVCPELGELAGSIEEAQLQVGRVSRPLRSGTHPLWLLVAIDWLFSDGGDFMAHLRSGAPQWDMADGATWGGAEGPSAPVVDQRRADLLAMLEGGQSATSAARVIGVDVSTAMAWAASCGRQVSRRPKLLSPDVRAALVRDLSEGGDKAHIAARHGISVESVTRFLRTEVGIHERWTLARLAKSQGEARAAWLELLGQYPALGIKFLRSMAPAAYAWLYRNDREWLTNHLPDRLARSGSTTRGSVRWDDRDRALSAEVERAALDLTQKSSGKALRLWQIYQAVPELRPKLSVLDKLPLTKRAIENALAKRQGTHRRGLFG